MSESFIPDDSNDDIEVWRTPDGGALVAVFEETEHGWAGSRANLSPADVQGLIAFLAAREATPSPTCPTAAAVARKITDRADVGLAKYGTTLAGAGLSRRELLVHMQEELMDAAVYAQRLIEMEDGA